MIISIWSMAALLTGFALDTIFGDKNDLPHIVRWMGSLITKLENFFRRISPATERGEREGGVFLVCAVTAICTVIPAAVLFLSYKFLPFVGYVIESLLCWQLLAAKSLKDESMKVFHSLEDGYIERAKRDLSMIVGRDTAGLDKDGIIRAAVETVAENTSDGVTAPLLFIMLGGAPLGCLYKAVNTMDSMVGYKNEKYIHFGRAAAKFDDFLNYIPSRLCALLMIAASFLLMLDGKNAIRIWRRDRNKHESPNSAQTEAVCAGALCIQLAGPASYFGELRDKPYIGDALFPIEPDDILTSNKLMYVTAVLTLVLAVAFRAVCFAVSFLGAI